jgi:hypothetical protein
MNTDRNEGETTSHPPDPLIGSGAPLRGGAWQQPVMAGFEARYSGCLNTEITEKAGRAQRKHTVEKQGIRKNGASGLCDTMKFWGKE